MVPPWFARFLTETALQSANTLPRCDGRSRRCLWEGHSRSAARLQDHVRQALPRLFPPYEALFAVSARLLFSSLSLQCLIFDCFTVYTPEADLSTDEMDIIFANGGGEIVHSNKICGIRRKNSRKGGPRKYFPVIGLKTGGKTGIIRAFQENFPDGGPPGTGRGRGGLWAVNGTGTG